jgi:proline racemase
MEPLVSVDSLKLLSERFSSERLAQCIKDAVPAVEEFLRAGVVVRSTYEYGCKNKSAALTADGTMSTAKMLVEGLVESREPEPETRISFFGGTLRATIESIKGAIEVLRIEMSKK